MKKRDLPQVSVDRYHENEKYTHKHRIVMSNLNIPTLRVAFYASRNDNVSFRRGRRISYAYPTPIFRSVIST